MFVCECICTPFLFSISISFSRPSLSPFLTLSLPLTFILSFSHCFYCLSHSPSHSFTNSLTLPPLTLTQSRSHSHSHSYSPSLFQQKKRKARKSEIDGQTTNEPSRPSGKQGRQAGRITTSFSFYSALSIFTERGNGRREEEKKV